MCSIVMGFGWHESNILANRIVNSCFLKSYLFGRPTAGN
uniref:Uncharacterized protein n=1 Tax=Rhizophora mucronata TaxID=61149 RepID=A0A2P2IJE8_RHIMU